jgi:hypothetical protein
MVDIMAVDIDKDGRYYFRTLNTIQSNFKPVTLQGDLLAISDDVAQTIMWDWRAGTSAILEHRTDDLAVWVASHFPICCVRFF